MITAIFKIKESNFKTNSIKQNNSTYISKSVLSDSISRNELKQISFKGNLTKAGGNILSESGSRLGKKIIKIAEEAIDSTKLFIKKLKKEEELPFTEKPIVSNYSSPTLIGNEKTDARRLGNFNTAKETVSDFNNHHDKHVSIDVNEDGTLKCGVYNKMDEIIKNEKAAEEAAKKAAKAKDNKRHHHDDFDDNDAHDLQNHHDGTSFSGDGSELDHTNIDDHINDLDVSDNFYNGNNADRISNYVGNNVQDGTDNLVGNFKGFGGHITSEAGDLVGNVSNHVLDSAEDLIGNIRNIDLPSFNIPKFDFNFNLHKVLEDIWDWLT